MVTWPSDWQDKLIQALTRAGADLPCPRCGHDDFSLVDGYVSLPLQATLAGGPASSLQTVATACERCGYIALHALNVVLESEEGGGTPATRPASPTGPDSAGSTGAGSPAEGGRE
jgi:hypothetical protein